MRLPIPPLSQVFHEPNQIHKGEHSSVKNSSAQLKIITKNYQYCLEVPGPSLIVNLILNNDQEPTKTYLLLVGCAVIVLALHYSGRG